jgi:tRNA_anti-like
MNMMATKGKMNPWLKRLLIGGLLLLLAGGGAVWYIFNEKFTDTSERKAAFTVNAIDLIHEFQQSDSLANKKYAEKIITVNGRISELEAADTTINVKMIDTLTDAYIIFAFQQQHLKEAKQLKEGDSVSIKGSCSGGSYSEILETEFITFKRCAVNK